MNVPARPWSGCAGTFFFCILVGAFGCDRAGRPEPVQLVINGDTITLPEGTRVFDIEASAPGGSGSLRPSNVEVSVGDVVRFIATDGQPHAFVFEPDSSAGALSAFLETSGQMRSPPLVSRDSRWIVSLEGAPTGTYPFRCLTHNARGLLMVVARGVSGG